jgi:hypothetical protein
MKNIMVLAFGVLAGFWFFDHGAATMASFSVFGPVSCGATNTFNTFCQNATPVFNGFFSIWFGVIASSVAKLLMDVCLPEKTDSKIPYIET